jgi:uncharacterized protein (TIGR02001 family)
MKKVVLSVVAALAVAAPAFAADVPVKAKKAAPVVAATPAWDIAFGGVVMSDYNFRGISQSNRGVSGGAYFEPQFNTSIGQIYLGIAAWGVNWPSNAAYGFTDPNAEVDLYGGWRNTWGAFSLDLGAIYYWYPKEQFNGVTAQSDFYEIYAKAGYAITSDLSVGANIFYTPDLLHYSTTFAGLGFASDASATYGSLTAKYVLPISVNGLGAFISGELGHWWISNSGWTNAIVVAAAGLTGNNPSYTYWNAGLALTYKAITLDLRYHDTNQSVRQCNDFLVVAAGNSSSNWCNGTFIASLKFDTTVSALK